MARNYALCPIFEHQLKSAARTPGRPSVFGRRVVVEDVLARVGDKVGLGGSRATCEEHYLNRIERRFHARERCGGTMEGQVMLIEAPWRVDVEGRVFESLNKAIKDGLRDRGDVTFVSRPRSLRKRLASWRRRGEG